MRRYLANHVVVDGVDHGMCIVEPAADGTYTLTPFTHEVHSTVYVGTRLELTTHPDHSPETKGRQLIVNR